MIRAEVRRADGTVKQEIIRNREVGYGVYDLELVVDPTASSQRAVYVERRLGAVEITKGSEDADYS